MGGVRGRTRSSRRGRDRRSGRFDAVVVGRWCVRIVVVALRCGGLLSSRSALVDMVDMATKKCIRPQAEESEDVVSSFFNGVSLRPLPLPRISWGHVSDKLSIAYFYRKGNTSWNTRVCAGLRVFLW